MLRRQSLRGGTLAVRRHEHRGPALRCILVLLPARVPSGGTGVGAPSGRGMVAHEGRSELSDASPRLRRFTGSDIELILDPVPEIETGRLSELVTQWIGARFGGDRRAAQSAATRSVARALDAHGPRSLARERAAGLRRAGASGRADPEHQSLAAGGQAKPGAAVARQGCRRVPFPRSTATPPAIASRAVASSDPVPRASERSIG